MRRSGFALAAALMLVAACGKARPTRRRAAHQKPAARLHPRRPAQPRTGTFTLASGQSVYYWCAGEGSPGVLLEAGTDSGGTDAYPSAFVDPLVAETRVCTYDRPGTGMSDPAPHRRRTLRDLCAVQDQVLAKLPLGTPYVLVGQSGGGNLNIGCAARHSERVAGLVTIDSYHDDPDDLRAEGFAWTDNPEFVDYVDYSEELDTLTTPIGDFPVLVISATQADPGGRKTRATGCGSPRIPGRLRSKVHTTCRRSPPSRSSPRSSRRFAASSQARASTTSIPQGVVRTQCEWPCPCQTIRPGTHGTTSPHIADGALDQRQIRTLTSTGRLIRGRPRGAPACSERPRPRASLVSQLP